MNEHDEDDDVLYDDDGEPVGHLAEAEDGATVLIDFDGDIIAAIAPDGTELDPSGYEVEGADFNQSLAEENFYDNAQTIEPEESDMSREEHEAAVRAEVDFQMNQLQAELGRPITVSEAQRMFPALDRQMQTTGRIDVADAAMDLMIAGKPLGDLDSREARVQFQCDRLADLDGKTLNPREPQAFDLDNRQQRVAAMTAAVEGTNVEGDQVYDSGEMSSPPASDVA